jgi:outer membrane protein assembly factor BamA
MSGKSASALCLLFVMILSPPAVWGSADPPAGQGFLVNSPAGRGMGIADPGFSNALILDAQEDRNAEPEARPEVHYNRVDGFFVQVGVDTRLRSPSKLRLFAWCGYAFKGKAWRYEIGLGKWIDLGPIRVEVGVRNYDLTFTEDKWLMPIYENSAAAFFFREDFRDYYRRTGSSFHLTNTLYKQLSLEVAYFLDDHESLGKKTNWSVFGGDKKFRENPEVDEGALRSMGIRVGYDTRDDFMEPTSGFLIEASFEKAGDSFGGKYDFRRFLLDFRRYLRLSAFENIDLRLRLGTASGDLPVQRTFDLGGIGSLRGYKFKELKDFDRMILGNMEYRIQFGRLAPDVMEDYQIIPFYDFGLAWSSNDKGSLSAGFDQLKWDGVKTSVGIGLSLGAGDDLRINLARRLDDRDRPVVVTVRINRIF